MGNKLRRLYKYLIYTWQLNRDYIKNWDQNSALAKGYFFISSIISSLNTSLLQLTLLTLSLLKKLESGIPLT